MNLIPQAIADTGNYWCTWRTQSTALESEAMRRDSRNLRNRIDEDFLFGQIGTLNRYFEGVRGDLIVVLDHGAIVQQGTHAALMAAIYCLLTVIFQPISFGAVQFRIAEALTLLPVIFPEAVSGLFVGCLMANLLGGGVWFDVVFGAIATLLAGLCTRRFASRPLLAAAMPVIFNGLIVGPVVYLGYIRAPGEAVDFTILYSTIGTVALGEAIVCFALGLLLVKVLRRIPDDALHR